MILNYNNFFNKLKLLNEDLTSKQMNNFINFEESRSIDVDNRLDNIGTILEKNGWFKSGRHRYTIKISNLDKSDNDNDSNIHKFIEKVKELEKDGYIIIRIPMIKNNKWSLKPYFGKKDYFHNKIDVNNVIKDDYLIINKLDNNYNYNFDGDIKNIDTTQYSNYFKDRKEIKGKIFDISNKFKASPSEINDIKSNLSNINSTYIKSIKNIDFKESTDNSDFITISFNAIDIATMSNEQQWTSCKNTNIKYKEYENENEDDDYDDYEDDDDYDNPDIEEGQYSEYIRSEIMNGLIVAYYHTKPIEELKKYDDYSYEKTFNCTNTLARINLVPYINNNSEIIYNAIEDLVYSDVQNTNIPNKLYNEIEKVIKLINQGYYGTYKFRDGIYNDHNKYEEIINLDFTEKDIIDYINNIDDINSIYKGNETFLTYLIGENKYFKILDKYFDYFINNKNLDINKHNKSGYTPLLKAISIKNVDVVKLLLHYKADVNLPRLNYNGELTKSTPLYQALYNIELNNLFMRDKEDLEIINLLIKNGAKDLNITSKDDNSLLHYVMDIKTLEFLLKNGLDVNIVNRHNENALIFSLGDRHYSKELYEKIKLLIKYKINIDEKNKNGTTALLYLVKKENFKNIKQTLDYIKLLVDNGAKLDIQNKIGETPLIEASERGYLEIVQYLVDKGANINLQNYQSKTALDLTNIQEIKDYLISKGAKSGKDIKENKIIKSFQDWLQS